MARKELVLSIASILFLLLVSRAGAQEPGRLSGVQARESRLQRLLVEAEFDLKMQELEFAMSERAIEEATIDCEKVKLQIEAARKQGDSRERGLAVLELKQAQVRVEMRKIQSKMTRLKTEKARAGLERIRAALAGRPEKPSPVQLEYIDDSDVVIIRGKKASVDKIRALIEGAEKKKVRE